MATSPCSRIRSTALRSNSSVSWGSSSIFTPNSLVEKEIREGSKLSDSMAKADFLPDVFTGLIEVGEQTGNLSEVFSEMEQRLRASYENSVTSFVTLIEPVMIILMGLIVGSVVVTMLLSMVSISDINF